MLTEANWAFGIARAHVITLNMPRCTFLLTTGKTSSCHSLTTSYGMFLSLQKKTRAFVFLLSWENDAITSYQSFIFIEYNFPTCLPYVVSRPLELRYLILASTRDVSVFICPNLTSFYLPFISWTVRMFYVMVTGLSHFKFIPDCPHFGCWVYLENLLAGWSLLILL